MRLQAVTAQGSQKVADRLYQTSPIQMGLEKTLAVISHNHTEEIKRLCCLSYCKYIFELADLVTFLEDL